MSEREQVWRERIEWQQWSGLTVAECSKLCCLRCSLTALRMFSSCLESARKIRCRVPLHL